jgi:hypothetical protein
MNDMTEKIRTDSETFKRAVARGDRRQIEEWDSRGQIEWHPSNFVGQQLSREAARRLQAQQAGASQEPVSRVDELVGKDERMPVRHKAVRSAFQRGDSQLLEELLADERFESPRGSGPFGSFTSGDLEAHYRKDAS